MSAWHRMTLLLFATVLMVFHQTDGGIYTRWGRTECPSCAKMVYKGYTAGSHYTHKGGASNYICLPEKPSWNNYSDAAETGRSYVYGTEYEIEAAFPINGKVKPLHNQDVPCVVCETPRTCHEMFPGVAGCYPGWTLEYTGYLVSAHYTHHRSEFVCLDATPEGIPGGAANVNGALMYLSHSVCGGVLPCPPYVHMRELACAVCSK